MGLNSIQNPAKLRRIAALIGDEVEYAAARYFADQRELIVFGRATGAWVVNLRKNSAERYNDERKLAVYRDKDGRPCGVSYQ